jgi:hypothetical protein
MDSGSYCVPQGPLKVLFKGHKWDRRKVDERYVERVAGDLQQDPALPRRRSGVWSSVPEVHSGISILTSPR